MPKKKIKECTRRKLLNVGDKVCHNGYEFIITERIVTINPITGLRAVQYKEVPM